MATTFLGCQQVAQLLLLPLGADVWALSLDELKHLLVLGHREHLRGVLKVRSYTPP